MTCISVYISNADTNLWYSQVYYNLPVSANQLPVFYKELEIIPRLDNLSLKIILKGLQNNDIYNSTVIGTSKNFAVPKYVCQSW